MTRIFKLFFRKERRHGERRLKTNAPPDRYLPLLTFTLAVFGLLMVYDSSIAIAIRDFSNPYHFVLEQARWLVVGVGAFLVCAHIHYRRWYVIALPFLLATLMLLCAVFIPGVGVKAMGAHRWLNFRLFIVQPAELAKLSLAVYLAAWFSIREKGRLVAFLLLLGTIFGLVVLEPDLGTGAIIIGIAMTMYFFSGAKISHFLFISPVLVIGVISLAIVSPYRFARLTTFLSPEHDPLGASYQIRQVQLGLGSGGLFGVGIGRSRQKYEYLPEANTDSIFAILAEEVGFVGSMIFILLFLGLIWRGFAIAARAPDRFGQLLAAGITSWIGIQSILNLAAMVGLIPLTGIPLPLISYGGSSLVVVLAGLGILTNISRHYEV